MGSTDYWGCKMSSKLKEEEGYLTKGYIVALEKERSAIIGRTMPGFIHEVNGSIGSMNTLASFMEDRLSHTKRNLLNNELKKSDLEELIQTFEESLANAFLICNHANEHNETIRKISNIQNKPCENSEDLNLLLHAFKVTLKPFLKKNNLKMNEELSADFSFFCDFSWVVTALCLWLQLFIEEKENDDTAEDNSIVTLVSKLEGNHFDVILETPHQFSQEIITALSEKNLLLFEESHMHKVSINCILLWLCLNIKLKHYEISYDAGINGRFVLIFKKTEELI